MTDFFEFIQHLADEGFAKNQDTGFEPINSAENLLNRFDYNIEAHLKIVVSNEIYKQISRREGIEKLYYIADLNRDLLTGMWESRSTDPFTNITQTIRRVVTSHWVEYFQKKVSRSKQYRKYLDLLIDPYNIIAYDNDFLETSHATLCRGEDSPYPTAPIAEVSP